MVTRGVGMADGQQPTSSNYDGHAIYRRHDAVIYQYGCSHGSEPLAPSEPRVRRALQRLRTCVPVSSASYSLHGSQSVPCSLQTWKLSGQFICPLAST